MVQINWTYQAKDDLKNILDYISHDSKHYAKLQEKQADKYYNTLIDNCKFIADNLQIGKDYSNILNILWAYRIKKDR